MHRADPAVADRLTRIRSLLSGLTGPLGNGEMLVRISAGDAESVPREVLALLDRLDHPGPTGVAGGGGIASAADLMTRLTESSQPAAGEILAWLLSTTPAYRVGAAGTTW